MWKRPTRKKLLQDIDTLALESCHHPVSVVKICHVNSWGVIDLESFKEFFNIEDVVCNLMDLSLSNRIVKVSNAGSLYYGGMLVVIRVMKDKECQTNIDAEMLDLISRIEFYKGDKND
jgi:hypothetical protein